MQAEVQPKLRILFIFFELLIFKCSDLSTTLGQEEIFYFKMQLMQMEAFLGRFHSCVSVIQESRLKLVVLPMNM